MWNSSRVTENKLRARGRGIQEEGRIKEKL